MRHSGIDLFAIDPGPEQPGFVEYRDGQILEHGKIEGDS